MRELRRDGVEQRATRSARNKHPPSLCESTSRSRSVARRVTFLEARARAASSGLRKPSGLDIPYSP